MNSLVMEPLSTADKSCYTESLAIATVPIQKWNTTYDLEKALQVGTIFPELHKPFYLGGDEKC